jgi:hypothetical protein
MSYVFENRAYGPESTPEEVQAIKECITVHEPGILLWRELPVHSLFSLDVVEERLQLLIRDLDRYDLLVDLVRAAPPSPAVRERLKRIFKSQAKLGRVAVFTERNFMLNVAAKFVLGGSVGLRKFSVHRTAEEALEELRHAPER